MSVAPGKDGDGDARDERDDLSGQRMVNIEPNPGEGDGDDELALRLLFQNAVSGLEPSHGSLEHLRRAVPARRARKRQAVVGAAAAAVLIGTAVPAFVHVASSGGVSAAGNPVNAGHGEEAQGGTGTETGIEGGQSPDGPANTGAPSQGAAEGSAGKPQRPGPGISGTGPRATAGAGDGSVPRCEAGQLGVSGAHVGGADGEGKVHGAFRIANVSGRDCVVDGSGVVSFEARGAADPARISVIRHTSGDGGSGLPDPSQESSALVLKPNGSYEVKFVWVPSDTCPTTGTTPTPTPTPTSDPPTTPPVTPTPTGGTGNPDPTGTGGTVPGGSEAGADSGAAPQLLRRDGGTADGSVVVSHVAEPGGPSASATIPNACAGTLYRTGVLAGS
ncbi:MULTISPECIES: hypothetical protein [Streptomyces]|uniref:DUF4232 domain-containing protein n=3 Tax=Streptomyces venezuelae TaxID=54571 RepID=F2RAH2_STRVP|nr:hypothetical protein [Streptomyces venezuelae]APE22470.1 hypothetical protein vnz_16595 [Streptomyces venezuelae]CCA56654.1 hypothetical protein SVEN_3368 [Streptomyces venezuelae ATCC 10712]